MYYGFTAIRDIYFSVNLFNFFYFSPRNKCFLRGNKFSTAEKSLYSEEKTFLRGNTVLRRGEKSLLQGENSYGPPYCETYNLDISGHS